jgi:hypothetical protein
MSLLLDVNHDYLPPKPDRIGVIAEPKIKSGDAGSLALGVQCASAIVASEPAIITSGCQPVQVACPVGHEYTHSERYVPAGSHSIGDFIGISSIGGSFRADIAAQGAGTIATSNYRDPAIGCP